MNHDTALGSNLGSHAADTTPAANGGSSIRPPVQASDLLRRRIRTACLTLLLGLIVIVLIRLAQFSLVEPGSSDRDLVLLEAEGADDWWVDLRWARRSEQDESELLHVVSSSQPVEIMGPGSTEHDSSSLEAGSVVKLGTTLFEVVMPRDEESNAIVYRLPIAVESSESGSYRSLLEGWTRIEIGGDARGVTGTRDRIVIPGASAIAALLPEGGSKFEPDLTGFRVSAETEGLHIWRPGNFSTALQVKKGRIDLTPNAAPTETLLRSGDHLTGLGFELEFQWIESIQSEPILDETGGIQAYAPRRLRELLVKDRWIARAGVSDGENSSQTLRMPRAILRPLASSVQGQESGHTASIVLSGHRRYMLVGKNQLLGRAKPGNLPDSLTDREFLALTQKAFQSGVLYEDRGFVYSVELPMLRAIQDLHSHPEAPRRHASKEDLQLFLQKVIEAPQGWLADRSAPSHAQRLLSRLPWESSEHNWQLPDDFLVRAQEDLRRLHRVGGPRLKTLVLQHNRSVFPMGIEASGEVRMPEASQAEGRIDLSFPNGWQGRMSSRPLPFPTDLPFVPLVPENANSSRWTINHGINPPELPPDTPVIEQFRREIQLARDAEGKLVVRAPAFLEVRINGSLVYRGAGSDRRTGAAVMIPVGFPAGASWLELLQIRYTPPRFDSTSVSGRWMSIDVEPEVKSVDQRAASWTLTQWQSPSADAVIRTRWPTLEETRAKQYVALYFEGEKAERRFRISTAHTIVSAWWNGQKVEIQPEGPHASKLPYEIAVSAPTGISSLKLELDLNADADLSSSPLYKEHETGWAVKTAAVTLHRPDPAQRFGRAAILDMDEYSCPAVVVERGAGGLRAGQELLLSGHEGRGDTTLLLLEKKSQGEVVAELSNLVRLFIMPLESAKAKESDYLGQKAGHRFDFEPLVAASFFRQENPLEPPFLPTSGYRVATNAREHFRDDRDQVLLGDRRIEYVEGFDHSVQAEIVVVGSSSLSGFKIDPLPDAITWNEAKRGVERVRWEATAAGVSMTYGGLGRVQIYRATESPIQLTDQSAPIKLQPDDRIYLPKESIILRYVERHGILAPAVAPPGLELRVIKGLSLEPLIGTSAGPAGGLEKVLDRVMTGELGVPARVKLTLDDDLQRLGREQLRREFRHLTSLKPRGLEDEDGQIRRRLDPDGAEKPKQVLANDWEGCLLLIDARTGAILAAVNEQRAETSRLLAWQDLRFHPGSTFKLVSALAILESTDPEARALVAGRLPQALQHEAGVDLFGSELSPMRSDEGGIPIRFHLRNHRRKPVMSGTTLEKALEQSLNTWFAYGSLLVHQPSRDHLTDTGFVGDRVYGEMFGLYQAARQLGFNRPFDLVPLDMPGDFNSEWLERSPPSFDAEGRLSMAGDVLLAAASSFPRDGLTLAEVANLGIGQGELFATPLQMALVASVYATGGSRYAPHLLAGLGPYDSRKSRTRNFARVRVSDAALSRIRTGMKAVVASGSAAGAFSDSPMAPYVFGKTGTAERALAGGELVNDSWFVGFVVPPRLDASSLDPALHELAFACLIPEAGLGGRHAAEVVDRFLRDVGRYYGWRYRRR